MKIQCPKCLKNYNVNLSVEEMPEEGSKFSCQNCNSQFFVRKRQDNSLVSLMKNIKGKLDDWDDDINGKALDKDEKDTLDMNQQENTEETAEEINQEADDLLNEILEEEKLEEASSGADQSDLTSETEMTTEATAPEKHEKVIEEEESQLMEEDLEELPEIAAEEEPPSPTEEPAAAAEGESGESGQDDIDKMLAEATSEQLEETLEESPEVAAEEQAPSPTEEPAAAKAVADEESPSPAEEPQAAAAEGESGESGQDDIDKMFAEATSEQLEGTLQESSEVAAEEQAPSPTEEPAAAKAVADEEPPSPAEEPQAAAAEGEPGESGQSDIDKMFAEATSQQLEGTLKESPEVAAEEQPPSPTEEPAAAAEGESGDSGQSDIDKMFAEATSQQLEGTLKESPEVAAEEQAPSPTEEPAAAAEGESGDSGQSDIDKMFAEATSQQLEGTLEEKSPATKEQASSDDPAKEDIDALWGAALEEAADTKKEESTDSEEKKPDETYSVQSDNFQNDLENLLEGIGDEADASPDKTDEKVEAKTKEDSKTEQLDETSSLVSDDAGETVADSQDEATVMEASSEEELGEIEGELSDSEIQEAKDTEEEIYEEGTETEIETLSESEKEPLKEKILFYKDMVVFFLTDKKKVVKYLIPAFITLSLISGGGYWHFSKSGDSEMTIAKGDDNETITVAKVDEKTETIEPVPAEVAKETETAKAEVAKKAETAKPGSAKESKPDNGSSVAKENRKKEVPKKETKKRVIPGATYPESKGKVRSISIGSIVPVVFSQDEIRVMSVNIKLDIDNKRVYEQVKKGIPFFEEKVESAIEKYFEGKFYREIQFVQEKLRKELHAKLNKEVKGGKIKDVDLEDFLIQ